MILCLFCDSIRFVRVLLLGSKGYMGEQFKALYPDAVCPSVDIAERAAVAELLDKEKPEVVINCAGKTGKPNVDWCEDHKPETFHANVTGVCVLLEECAARNLYLVHLSSGCIYAGDNGGKGFSEDDPPNFAGSFYSRTKAWSDQMCKDFADFPGGGGVLTLRLRMPFDGTKAPRNLLSKISKYQKVLDYENSLTYIPDFLDVAQKLIAKRKTGVYNVVNEGVMSPFGIMTLWKEIVDPSHACERINAAELDTITKAGRSNCMLNTDKLKTQGLQLRPVEEAVREALRQIKDAF